MVLNAGALLLSLLPFWLPLYNPDLFWHLSAGEWMLERGRVVREDFLSYSMAGAPWADFEWLSQILYQAVFGAGGMAGLWVCKNILLAASAGALWATLSGYGLPPWARAAGLVAWSAGMLSHSDLRPDQFSVVFFQILLLGRERLRLRGGVPGAREFTACALGFALWANLHAGFATGLGLLGCYVAADVLEKRKRPLAGLALLAAAVVGTFFNPFGAQPYQVLWEHWSQQALLTRHIQEWQPTSFSNMFHRPFWPILAAFLAGVLGAVWRRRGMPLAPVIAGLGLAWSAVQHTRLGALFVPLAVPLSLRLAQETGWLERPAGRRTLAAAAAVWAAYMVFLVGRVAWPGFFDARYLPRRAAEFMERHQEVLAGKRLYNPWEWGGYLGWRLAPWHKVFGDGRYLFHAHLAEIGEANKSVESGRRWAETKGLEGVLVRNIPVLLPSRRIYPDGSEKTFMRPWWLFTFPKERWALVYWDDQALILLDRAKAPAAWLAGQEYRFFRPRDDEAFAEVMARREIPQNAVEAERRRHGAEIAWTEEAARTWTENRWRSRR